MRRVSRLTLKLVLLMAIAMLSGRVNYGAPDPPKRLWGNYLPDVTLTTQDNKEVRFYEDLIKGKLVVINFMYTTCDSDL